MSEEQNENKVDVYETNRFAKAMNRLDESQSEIVENEIDNIIENPELGVQKKGDLSYLRIHKFDLEGAEYLLGYNWSKMRMVIHLLQLGSHENYYRDAKKRRKADLRAINS